MGVYDPTSKDDLKVLEGSPTPYTTEARCFLCSSAIEGPFELWNGHVLTGSGPDLASILLHPGCAVEIATSFIADIQAYWKIDVQTRGARVQPRIRNWRKM